ncbi:MAG: hypothetical protein K6G50_07300 [bacterium]|nr:hypothetical protein [bacterium]
MAKKKTDLRKAMRDNTTIYKASMKYYFYSLVPAVPAVCCLGYYGLDTLKKIPPEAEDPFRFISGYLPILLALLCFIALIGVFVLNFRRKVGINASHFIYTNGFSKPVAMTWKDLIANFPQVSEKKLFDHFAISDGKASVQLERFFFPDYDTICEAITQHKKTSKAKELSL